jgi:hypothetical protein
MSEPARFTAFDLPGDHVLHRVQGGALVVGGLGIIGCLVGLFAARAQFFQAYIVSYLFFLGLGLGSMAILMLQYITGGAWGAVIRRLLESATRTLPLLALLFLPIAPPDLPRGAPGARRARTIPSTRALRTCRLSQRRSSLRLDRDRLLNRWSSSRTPADRAHASPDAEPRRPCSRLTRRAAWTGHVARAALVRRSTRDGGRAGGSRSRS